MSDLPSVPFQTSPGNRHIIGWLGSLGVLCDCDNGWRVHDSDYDFPKANKCDRCTLIEVGGIRVRATAVHYASSSAREWPVNGVLLPAVEVTDE